jgi:shikimate dehydrogenase
MKAKPTPFLHACRERGIAAHDGFKMLAQQVPDYLDFFGLHAAAHGVRDDFPELRALMAQAQ